MRRTVSGAAPVAPVCGCSETYPQLVPGRMSHAPGCSRGRAVARSGRTRTRAERRDAGWKRIDVLADARTLERLDEIREAEGGISRAEMIRTMIDGTWSEMRDAGELGKK